MKMKWKKTTLILFGLVLLFTGCGSAGGKKQVQNVDFAMGTVISQNIYGGDGEETAAQVLDLIKKLENQISWRIDNSSVAAINRAAGTEAVVEVEEDLAEWITLCQQVYEKSGGALDLTVGPASRLWDIGGENPHVASEEEIEKILPMIDGSSLIVNGNQITFTTEDGQLDLGAVGKGIACDVIKEYLEEKYGTGIDGTFSAGGSVLIYGSKPNKEPWKIGIQDPRGEDGSYMGALSLGNEESGSVCVSTSGDYEKYIEEDGVRYHHILNPKTGAPAESDLISVTVISQSGLLSDALSTACFVSGTDEALKIAEEFGAEVILINQEKEVILSEGAKTMFSLLEKEYQIKDEEK